MQKTLVLFALLTLGLLLMPDISGAQQDAVSISAVTGAESVDVRGHAAPGSTVALQLLATLSFDVPTVMVGRYVAHSDVGGNYELVIPIAPDFVRNTYLSVIASAAGVSSASGRIVIGSPNAGAMVPLEQQTP
jgi:hypothetical protein